MELNHTIVAANDKKASAEFFARIMGLEALPGEGHFAQVRINDGLTFDFANSDSVSLWEGNNGHFLREHYAFKVTEEDFDAIFGRIQAEGLRYGSGPGPNLYDMKINNHRGGRGVYFDELNGHSIELLTVSHS